MEEESDDDVYDLNKDETPRIVRTRDPAESSAESEKESDDLMNVVDKLGENITLNLDEDEKGATDEDVVMEKQFSGFNRLTLFTPVNFDLDEMERIVNEEYSGDTSSSNIGMESDDSYDAGGNDEDLNEPSVIKDTGFSLEESHLINRRSLRCFAVDGIRVFVVVLVFDDEIASFEIWGFDWELELVNWRLFEAADATAKLESGFVVFVDLLAEESCSMKKDDVDAVN
ncbi:hypothetical protein Droror1_Dr00027367 [Drosera rotundifolia]